MRQNKICPAKSLLRLLSVRYYLFKSLYLIRGWSGRDECIEFDISAKQAQLERSNLSDGSGPLRSGRIVGKQELGRRLHRGGRYLRLARNSGTIPLLDSSRHGARHKLRRLGV